MNFNRNEERLYHAEFHSRFNQWTPNRFDLLVSRPANREFITECLREMFYYAPDFFHCRETTQYLEQSMVLRELASEVAEECGYRRDTHNNFRREGNNDWFPTTQGSDGIVCVARNPKTRG